MARGSRYRIEGQLVGPGVMDQLSWVDKAKGRTHINAIPVPDASFSPGTETELIFTVASSFGGAVANPENLTFEAGDLLRIVNTAASNNRDVSFFNGSTRVSTTMIITSGSELFCIIPPGADRITFVGSSNLTLEFTKDS